MTAGTGEGREHAETTHKRGDIPADTLMARLMLTRMHAGHLTIREAADRCGLNYGSWSNWENGAKPRDLLTIVQAISDGLEIDHDWLLFGGPLVEPRGVPVRRRSAESTVPLKRRYGCVPDRPMGTRPVSGPPAGPRTRRPTGHPRPVVAGSMTRRPVRISDPVTVVDDLPAA